jgi:integrase
MPKRELTAKTVAKLELSPGKSDELVWDAKTPGFAVRVRRAADDSIHRMWVAQRKRHGKIIRIKIGSASEMAIDVARSEARKLLAKIDLGHNPAAERRAETAKNDRTMGALVAEYLEKKKREVRPSTLDEITRYLSKGPHFKTLHNVPVHEIDRARVASCLRVIVNEGKAATAREARQCLSAFFVWAMGEGLAELNPVIGTNRPEGIKPRERVLDDGELAAIWRACGDDDGGRVVKLLILTGCRRSEIGALSWSWFVPDMASFTIPSERSKNGRAHMLPVMPMMRSIIEGVPRVANRDQLFGLSHAGGFSMWAEGKKALDRKLGGNVKPWRLHDLRRSVATKMADIGVQPHIIEAALNHQSGHKAGVAGIYNRSSYKIEVRNALATWHDHLRTLVAGGKRKVLSFPATA